MIKYIKAVFELKTIIRCNMLIYYLDKIPFLGKHISRFLYKHTELKKMFAVLSNIFLIIGLTAVKLGSIVLFILLPFTWYTAKNNILIVDYPVYYFQAIFFFFCILGSFQESRTFLVSKIKYICLSHIKMPVKEGILAFLIIEYVIQFISIGFVFGVCNKFLLQNTTYSLVLGMAYISLQLVSESIHLAVFKRTLLPLEKKKSFSVLLLAISILGAYGPLMISDRLLISEILTNKLFVIILGMLLVISVYYIFVAYRGYTDELVCIFKKSDLVEELARKKQETIYNAEADIKLEYPRNIKNLHGFKLLNSLFTIRNKHQLLKYLKRRFVFLFLIVSLTMLCLINDFFSTQRILNRIYLFTPILPIIICQYAYGEGFCKFYYKNCDSKLLVYNFYRTREAILSNFFIKLKKILKHNIILGIGTVILILTIFKIAKIDFLNGEFLLFVITIFLLLIVFGIHHISVYYLVQPYIKESSIQNPIVFMIQMPMIVIAYVLTMSSLEPMFMMLILIIGGTIYSLILLLAVFIKGSSTFVLK